jgi:NhaP-type Na+/H+ or K+/H+ antiporter
MNAPGKPWSGSRRSLKGVILGALLGTLTGGIGGACLGWALWNSPQQYYQMSGRSNLGGVLLENALALALAGLIVGALLGGMAGVLFEQWQRRCGPAQIGPEVAKESKGA